MTSPIVVNCEDPLPAKTHLTVKLSLDVCWATTMQESPPLEPFDGDTWPFIVGTWAVLEGTSAVLEGGWRV